MASPNIMQRVKDSQGALLLQTVPGSFSDYRVFAASAAESHTVPTGVKWCVVTPSVDTYVNPTAAAAVPAADITDGTGPIYCPARVPTYVPVVPASTLSVIATAAGIVSLYFHT